MGKQYCVGFSIIHPISYWFFGNVDRWAEQILITVRGNSSGSGFNSAKFQLTLLKACLEQSFFSPIVNTAFMLSNALVVEEYENKTSGANKDISRAEPRWSVLKLLAYIWKFIQQDLATV